MRNFYVLHYWKRGLQVGKGYDTYEEADAQVAKLNPQGARPFVVQVVKESPK